MIRADGVTVDQTHGASAPSLAEEGGLELIVGHIKEMFRNRSARSTGTSLTEISLLELSRLRAATPRP